MFLVVFINSVIVEYIRQCKVKFFYTKIEGSTSYRRHKVDSVWECLVDLRVQGVSTKL